MILDAGRAEKGIWRDLGVSKGSVDRRQTGCESYKGGLLGHCAPTHHTNAGGFRMVLTTAHMLSLCLRKAVIKAR